MATQQGFSRRPRVGGANGQSEERFRAAFKIIADTVTKLELDQDVREAAQVPLLCPAHVISCHRHAVRVSNRELMLQSAKVLQYYCALPVSSHATTMQYEPAILS